MKRPQRTLYLSRLLLMDLRFPPQSPAFTLVELLVAAGLGAVILAVAARVLTADIRSNSSQEAIQRLRIIGAGQLLFGYRGSRGVEREPGGGKRGLCRVSTPLLTISVPAPGTAAGIGTIYYYSQNGDLWRCGPDIADDGSLMFDAIANGMLVENSTLQVEIQNSTFVTYVLTMNSRASRDGLSYSAVGEARTTARACDGESGICY